MSLRILGFTAGARTKKFAAVVKIAGLNVAFEDIQIGVDNETEAFLKNCHPCQRVPVMDCGADGYIFESFAIYRHLLRLADKNGKSLYGTSAIESSQIDMWIDFTANELDHNIGPILYTAMGFFNFSEEELNKKYDALNHALTGLEAWLETRTFLVGERLSGADLAVATSLEVLLSALSKSYDLWKYKNVVRYYMTVFYAHPGFAEAQKVTGGNGFPVAKPEAPKKEAPKKEAPAKKEAAPAAGNDDDEGEDELAIEAPKKKNPLDELPPSKFVLDAFKREYSNNKDTRNGVTKWLWENFDKEGFTMWFCKYKYNDELTKSFMTSNLVRGWFQRMDGCRKYAFGIALILGTEESHEIHAYWIFRGTGAELPEVVKDVEDVSLYEWRQCDLDKDKELIADFLCWEGKSLPKPCLEGRAFK